jgi:hypothetical protein
MAQPDGADDELQNRDGCDHLVELIALQSPLQGKKRPTSSVEMANRRKAIFRQRS